MQLLVSFEYYIKKIYLFVIGSRFVAQVQKNWDMSPMSPIQ